MGTSCDCSTKEYDYDRKAVGLCRVVCLQMYVVAVNSLQCSKLRQLLGLLLCGKPLPRTFEYHISIVVRMVCMVPCGCTCAPLFKRKELVPRSVQGQALSSTSNPGRSLVLLTPPQGFLPIESRTFRPRSLMFLRSGRSAIS